MLTSSGHNLILFVLRGLVLVLITAIAVGYLLANQERGGIELSQFMLLLILAVGGAGVVIAVDAFSPKKKLSAISGVFLGLIVGLIVLLPLSYIIDLIGVLVESGNPAEQAALANLLRGVKVILGVITCYTCISLVLQTKDDFRFIIPYVEFAKQIRGNRPIILDTSVIVDGRVVDIVETQIMQGSLIIPKFVLEELQTIADSGDKLKRARGRRGLEVLQKLQANDKAEVHVEDREAEGIDVDQKLIDLAQQMQGRVMTNDFNLNKVATLRGVDVINLNDLAKALRPIVLPGEHMTVKLVKPGESPTQGVGYLDDGTMVVVENGRSHLDHQVDLIVTSTLQTSAGRMIFGRFAHEDDDTPDSEAETIEAIEKTTEPNGPNPGSGPYPPTSSRRKQPSGSRRNPRRG
ncbi:MAG: PIN/TRAM domain-containing protein [Planctomycetota bacterium]